MSIGSPIHMVVTMVTQIYIYWNDVTSLVYTAAITMVALALSRVYYFIVQHFVPELLCILNIAFSFRFLVDISC